MLRFVKQTNEWIRKCLHKRETDNELARKPIPVIIFLYYTGSVQNEYHYICLLANQKCELTTVVAPTITR